MATELIHRLPGIGPRASRSTPARIVGKAYRRLRDRLAETLYRDEMGHGAWAADVGLLGPRAFQRDAESLLAGIRLGGGQGGPPPP
jgi:hypothetical protein